jgi:hypothetical protein
MIPLHMKFNYGGVTKNRLVRYEEAKTLCAALQAIAGTYDPSLVMLGDTNILDNAEPTLETFNNAAFIDLHNNDATTYWSSPRGERPFDSILIGPTAPSSATSDSMFCAPPTSNSTTAFCLTTTGSK